MHIPPRVVNRTEHCDRSHQILSPFLGQGLGTRLIPHVRHFSIGYNTILLLWPGVTNTCIQTINGYGHSLVIDEPYAGRKAYAVTVSDVSLQSGAVPLYWCPLSFDVVKRMHKECLKPLIFHQNGQKYHSEFLGKPMQYAHHMYTFHHNIKYGPRPNTVYMHMHTD